MWRIQLLGGLRATRGNAVLAQFPSRPVAMLLALLALNPQRRHSREEVIEMLWPGVELDIGRNRLRQVLSTLRRLLEPADVPPDSVLIADRQTIGLNAEAVTCDASEFELLLRRGAIAQALECYRGDFMPGFLDEWVEDERTRLSALHARALVRGDAAIEKGRSPELATGDRAPAIAAERESRNLPSYVSVFFDRDDEKRRIIDALAEHRLITLAGLGGFGKTRLAVESARVAEGFDTVAFVPLSECGDASLIADCIRSALQMEATQEDALAQLCAFLNDRDVLLMLDNFEHLVDEGTQIIIDLLERLARLRCLVTSQRVLDVPGEHVLTIDPLPVPRASMDPAEAVATPSLALFIDRARGARADFALTEDNRAALIELTRALEGLPLAIEIAASRIRSYSPREMRDALAERFELLTRQGQRGTRHGRHASLQATIEWSWNLLSETQRVFFAALSVFRGGFGVPAVEAVCAAADARAQLESLVSASLVRAETDQAGATRFSMLETLREFAQERLGDRARELRARHREYFLKLAREAATRDDAIAEREMPNLKHALVTAMEDSDPAYVLDLGVALRPRWEAHGTLPDDLRLLGEAVDRCTNDAPSLHAGLNLLAQLSLTAGDTERGRRYAQRALQEAAEDPARKAAALVTLARIDWERDQRDKGITRSLDEAFALAAKAGAENVQADALHVKGTIALKHGEDDGDFRAAESFFERAEPLYRKIGQPRKAHRVLLSRAGALTGLKRYKEARKLLAECERYFGELDSVADLIAVANMTGFLESAQEHWKEALAAGRRVVQLAWERHAHLWLATALWNLPQPMLMLGDVEAAEKLTSFAVGFWERGIGPISAHDVGVVEKQRKSTAKQLGAPHEKTLWAEGAALSLAEAVQLALTGRA